MELSDIIKSIQKHSKVGIGKLSNRTGISTAHLVPKRLNKATLPTLIRICDALGVELCIIDGWQKYKINNFPCIPEIETFFNEMNKVMPHYGDRYKEQNERRI